MQLPLFTLTTYSGRKAKACRHIFQKAADSESPPTLWLNASEAAAASEIKQLQKFTDWRLGITASEAAAASVRLLQPPKFTD